MSFALRSHCRRLLPLLGILSLFGAPASLRAIDPPSVPGAIPEVHALLAYLESIHGNHILSGQQEKVDWFGNDQEGMFDYLFANTGKYPAVRGFDFMFVSDPRNTMQRIGERAIAWAQRGGIVTIAFHWFVSVDSVGGEGGAFYRQSTNPTNYTNFRMARAVIEGTPENAEFVAEMDLVATQLKQLRDAGVPVIWRPFHEAGGTWFWWSGTGTAADAQAYRDGWRFMWNRFTHVHGLTNLIWAFNPNDLNILTNWYPGDDYVDMITLDVYPNAGHPVHATEYRQYRDFTNGRKLVALSENGRIPDPDELAVQNVGWTYFCTWDGDFITSDTYNDLAFKQKVYAHSRVLTLDELPDVYRFGRAPRFLTQPAALSVATGTSATFSPSAAANEAITYQWFRNGTALSGATEAGLTLANATAAHSGIYTVAATTAVGTTTSNGAALVVGPATGRLANLSTRGEVRSGNEVMFAGFVLGGTAPHRVLLRAIGPGLTAFGLPAADVLTNPQLELYSGQTVIEANDDWAAEAVAAAGITAAASNVGAFALDPVSADAALVATLAPGPYTARVSGTDGGSGVAIVEVYDADTGATSARLTNISTRGYVATGNSIMIPGIVVHEPGRRLLIRAIGPGLAFSGLTPLLPNPQLRVVDARGIEVFRNTDWGSTTTAPETVAAGHATGAFALPDGSKDAAVVVSLPAGNYTVLVSDEADGQGIALVEVYEMEP